MGICRWSALLTRYLYLYLIVFGRRLSSSPAGIENGRMQRRIEHDGKGLLYQLMLFLIAPVPSHTQPQGLVAR